MTLIPESSSNSNISSSLSGLASIAGVELGGVDKQVSISPALYKTIANSSMYALAMLEKEFTKAGTSQKVTLRKFFEENYDFGFLPSWSYNNSKDSEGLVSSNSRLKGIEYLNSVDYAYINIIRDKVFVEMDWKLNLVTIEVEFQDPYIAAELTEYTREYITQYVTNYATQKTKEQLGYIDIELKRIGELYKESQFKLAQYRDVNKNVLSAQASILESELAADFSLLQGIYNELRRQRENLNLKMSQQTPVFTILEPAKFPLEKSKPQRKLIVILFAIIGGFVSLTWLIIVPIIIGYKNKLFSSIE